MHLADVAGRNAAAQRAEAADRVVPHQQPGGCRRGACRARSEGRIQRVEVVSSRSRSRRRRTPRAGVGGTVSVIASPPPRARRAPSDRRVRRMTGVRRATGTRRAVSPAATRVGDTRSDPWRAGASTRAEVRGQSMGFTGCLPRGRKLPPECHGASASGDGGDAREVRLAYSRVHTRDDVDDLGDVEVGRGAQVGVGEVLGHAPPPLDERQGGTHARAHRRVEVGIHAGRHECESGVRTSGPVTSPNARAAASAGITHRRAQRGAQRGLEAVSATSPSPCAKCGSPT